MSLLFKRQAVAAFASVLFVPAAMAALGGGGATLPARAYLGANASVDATGPRFGVPAADSLLGAATSTPVSYCQIGSGGGRSVITSTSGNTDDTRACPATFNDAFVNGTSGVASPRVDADFAASDAPASSGDFQAFVTNEGKQHTQLTQFPSVIGNVGVIAHHSGLLAATNIYLTEAELCNIWSGKITNWSQMVRANGTPYPAKPITLVYRSDSSGTSFGFTNHLNWVCQDGTLNETLSSVASPLPFAVGDNFSVNSTFGSAFPVNTGIPANSTSASGNPGVVSAVAAIDGAIGYAEAANVKVLNSPSVKAAYVTSVDTVAELSPLAPTTPRNTAPYKNPLTNTAEFTLAQKYTDKDGVQYNTVYTAKALQANSATFGRPVGLGVDLNRTLASQPNCVFLVQPGAYATSQYKTAGNPRSGYSFYPIGVVTYLLGNSRGNFDVANQRLLLGAPYNTAIRPTVKTVGANTGYFYIKNIVAKAPTGTALVHLNQAQINLCTN